MPLYADVILPLAVPGVFTFELPTELQDSAAVGKRVVVPFGAGRKLYGAIVRRVHDMPPIQRSPRSILSILDDTPVCTEEQFALWEKVSEHYMCSMGELMLAAMPGALVLTSETRVVASATPAVQWTGKHKHDLLIEALERQQELRLGDAADLLGVRDPMPVIKKLLDQGYLMLAEEISDTYKPRMDRYVQLAPDARSEDALRNWFDKLENAPKQLHLLMRLVELGRYLTDEPVEVKRDKLLRASGASSADLKNLCTKGIALVIEREAGSVAAEQHKAHVVSLSTAQRAALDEVRKGFEDHAAVLLHGVTASGKTELYMELITEMIDSGKQCLYLLPEIALTTQVIGRLRARFGDRVGVFHSRLSARERTELWLRMLRDPMAQPVLVGARSAIFLPFHHLGLVIVDEEHDPSYKQQDPAPRYNARDMAVVLAAIHGGTTLLGSATPSMESRFNALNGKYGHARLLVRHGDATLPEVRCVDLADAAKRKLMRDHFSQQLIDGITAAVTRHEQAIIFQNRRGYVPVWQCEVCGWVPGCDHCDVSLTYHKQQHGLRCHYCGRGYAPPVHCASCGSNRLRMLGFGTEKIEEELALILPEVRVARMDQDTTRGKMAFERILTKFGEGGTDVLVGTQMVTKGLDFDQVTVIGILNADQLLRFPDLRAHERAFQLMSQVAGRSGRKNDPGTVFIQARDIHHPVIGFVMAHDVEGMYDREIIHREAHGYPPFTRLVRLTLKHRSEEKVAHTANELGALLRSRLGDRALGPEPPPVARIRDLHLRDILLKLDRGHYRSEKEFLRSSIDQLFAAPEHRPVRLVVDVDPM